MGSPSDQVHGALPSTDTVPVPCPSPTRGLGHESCTTEAICAQDRGRRRHPGPGSGRVSPPAQARALLGRCERGTVASSACAIVQAADRAGGSSWLLLTATIAPRRGYLGQDVRLSGMETTVHGCLYRNLYYSRAARGFRGVWSRCNNADSIAAAEARNRVVGLGGESRGDGNGNGGGEIRPGESGTWRVQVSCAL